jgi:hypothetical protein
MMPPTGLGGTNILPPRARISESPTAWHNSFLCGRDAPRGHGRKPKSGDYSAMRPIMLALVLSLLSASATLAERPLVTAPWWQLCGNRPSLPFDPHFSCCCRGPTGKHCVRHGSGGFLLNCIQICDVAPCR